MDDPSHQTVFPERHCETPFRTSSRRSCCSESKASMETIQANPLVIVEKAIQDGRSREERVRRKERRSFHIISESTRGIIADRICIRKTRTRLGACDSSPARVRVSINRPHNDRRTESNQNTSLHESREVVNWVSEWTFVGLSHCGHR